MSVYLYNREPGPGTLWVRRWLGIGLAVSVVSLAVSVEAPDRWTNILAPLGIAGCILFGLFFWSVEVFIRRRRAGSFKSAIEVTPAGVCRRVGAQSLFLERAELTGFSELPRQKGLSIRTASRERQIGVSSEIDGFDRLRAELVAMGLEALPPQTWNNDWRYRVRVFAPVAVIVLGVGMMVVTSAPVAVVVGAMLFLGGAAWAFFRRPVCTGGSCGLQSRTLRWVWLWFVFANCMYPVRTSLHVHLPRVVTGVVVAGDLLCLLLILQDGKWRRPRRLPPVSLLLACLLLVPGYSAQAQRGRAGHSLGTASVQGNLIVVTLNPGALGTENFFNLDQRTLRFTPGAGGYKVENLPLQWDPGFGDEATTAQVTLHNFAFPFSGRDWNEISIGGNGSITFGAPAAGGRGGGGRGGVVLQRYDEMQVADRTLVNSQNAICVLLRVRWTGKRYVKELSDRVVITWDRSEPYAGIQDWTWHPTVNRFQAVLHRDGTVEMAYNHISVKDGIVGLYPAVSAGTEAPLATLPAAAASTSLQDVKLAAVDGLYLQATFEMKQPVAQPGDAGVTGTGYHLYLRGSGASTEVEWSIAGVAGGRGGANATRYIANGRGVSAGVEVMGNTIRMRGVLPPELAAAGSVSVRAETGGGAAGARQVRLTGLKSPEVDFASLKGDAGPYPVVFEGFHYLSPTDPRDLACTVIGALGDHYDDLAYYSDFRVDNPEAGTPSEGPRGAGPNGTVSGIGGGGARPSNSADYCSQGRFQWGYVQPVDADANQMRAQPPADVMDANIHNIMAYEKQLGEISPDGAMPPYQYAISQIGHEMEHRWSAFARAKVGDKMIDLGPTHWARGLQALVPFPYERPSEASAMGGGVWQDNFDGTYTQLDDDYYVPPTGYSYLDLYLMGLIGPAEVPDFFLLTNLVPAGRDANGHPIFKADRQKITIQDVIAAEGARAPDVAHSQRAFNTGMVVIVEHGQKPTPGLIDSVNGIRLQWMKYFDRVTGGRATMTANPR